MEGTRSSLDSRTKLDAPPQGRWRVAVYVDAGEAAGSFRSAAGAPRPGRGSFQPEPDGGAGRRARRQLRRYCAANRLNRHLTLTYAPPFCTDERRLRDNLAVFFRRLRRRLGGRPLPYAWVPERHADGERLHVHCALGRYVQRSMIDAAWGHGIFYITQIDSLPVGSTVRDEARVAARYLAKYVGKEIGGRAGTGLHRYEVAQGFQPSAKVVSAPTGWAALKAAEDLMGDSAREVWWSRDQAGWEGPPSVWAQWA